MVDYTLKPMTETSWILQRDGMRLALIMAKDGQLISMGKLEKSKFKDLAELGKFLGGKVVIEEPEEDSSGEELGNIGGYPIKHNNAVPVDGSELPTYKRGKTEHSAGYYGIKFNHGWVTSYCPKLTTLTENEYIGPFRTKLEMLNSIAQKKRAIDI